MKVEQIQKLVLYRYRYVIAYAILIFVGVFSLLFKLGTLVPGISRNEAALALNNLDASSIFEQGVYLPYNLLQWLSFQVIGTDALSVRLASVIFAALSLIMLFWLLHMWHKDKIAIAIVIFMATSSWFLNYARYGGEEIFLAFSLIGLIFVATVIRHYSHRIINLILAASIIALSLYSPFMIYIIVLFALLYRRELMEIFKELSPLKIVLGSVVFGLTLLPLVYGFASDLSNLRLWLGFDGTLSSFGDYFTNMNDAIAHIFWRSTDFAELHLGDLAMLDIFTATMIALGLYHYEQHFNLLRTKFLIYGLGLTFLTLGFSSNQLNYILVAPLLYILAATGIVTLLQQWNKIFPINPFARMLGIIPMIIAIVITSNYHMNRYFYAWAGNPPVKLVYSVEPSSLARDLEQAIPGKLATIYIPSKQLDQTVFLTFEYRTQIEIKDIAEYDRTKEIARNQLIYVHGSLDHKKPKGSTEMRILATDSKTIPTAYTVYSK